MEKPSDTHSCTAFLQWMLPQLGYRLRGFRKVRKTVCKKIRKRMAALHIESFPAYRHYLTLEKEEWPWLDSFCRITISRFYRDRAVFDLLQTNILPALSDRQPLHCWCVGISSGEEPYTLAMLLAEMPLKHSKIMATEIDPHMINRAERGCYPEGVMKELPARWKEKYFTGKEELCLKAEIKQTVEFHQQDIRQDMPEGSFALVLSRNLIAMYFDQKTQLHLFRDIHQRMPPGGALILGKHESLPVGLEGFAPWFPQENIYRKI